MVWLSQFFLNPALAALGIGLISIPIVIHLINRLQYRKVRFAAMEFLLQSQQRNRRRILLEQLLLLLLRILMVLLLVALFARLILDPSQLSLLEKPETHHIVLLDDSGSMRDRRGDTTAYQAGLAAVKQLVSDLAGHSGLQTVTLLTLSQPDRTASSFTRRQVDIAMVSELEDKLEAMQRECGYGSPSWPEAFAAVQRLVSASSTQQSVVHVISDFRSREWGNNSGRTADLETLTADQTLVNLVPAVPARHENLGITRVTGDWQIAAVRVPVGLRAEITNFGTTVAENVSVRVLIDGEPIPQTLSIPQIEPGDTVSEAFEIVLETPGEHAIEVQLTPDALDIDNTYYLSINVPDKQRVLIADGTPGFTESQFVGDALAADSSVTGIDVLIVRPDAVRDQDLSNFTAVYLLNVSSLPPDAVQLLKDYVKSGGGLAWFLGNQIDAGFYRELSRSGRKPDQTNPTGEAGSETESVADRAENSREPGAGAVTPADATFDSLFPVPIAVSPLELARRDETSPGADLDLEDHPVLEFLNAADGLLSNYVNIYRYFPLNLPSGESLPPGARVIARLRNQAPLMFEHRYGQGRVITCLTSVGPMENGLERRWHNWPFDVNAPGFTVLHLELVKYLGSRRGGRTPLQIGEPLSIAVNPAIHLPEIRIEPPVSTGSSSIALQATPGAKPETDSPPDTGSGTTGQEIWQARFEDTRRPGIYRLIRENLSREPETELIAMNVPPVEGELELVSSAQLRSGFAELDRVFVQDFGEMQGVRRNDPGRELRTLLLLVLVAVLLAEQALAYRLSYHSADSGRSAKPENANRTRGPRTGGRTTSDRGLPATEGVLR